VVLHAHLEGNFIRSEYRSNVQQMPALSAREAVFFGAVRLIVEKKLTKIAISIPSTGYWNRASSEGDYT